MASFAASPIDSAVPTPPLPSPHWLSLLQFLPVAHCVCELWRDMTPSLHSFTLCVLRIDQCPHALGERSTYCAMIPALL